MDKVHSYRISYFCGALMALVKALESETDLSPSLTHEVRLLVDAILLDVAKED